MAAKQLASFPSLLFLFFLAFTAFQSTQASYEKEKKAVMSAVEGVVYCQSCTHVGTSSLIDAKPILSAKVGVTCKDHKGNLSFFKVFVTDPNGYFYAPLHGFKIEHSYLDHPLQSCTVHLLSSPHPSCNVPSNVNSGLVGSPLRYERKRLSRKDYEMVLYAAGPLAFHPSDCLVTIHN
ncbi:non-classical arabinogalactan protein 30-like [Magnolia sinica]|uniref:non-classical arabinogalactan protein 30-like n=1 Tax=Magnolia sinica TaxID=86752 RepID=UPI00265950C2|nr:non-classical arabinogalactan protein 30-like [Magnolia sinica]